MSIAGLKLCYSCTRCWWGRIWSITLSSAHPTIVKMSLRWKKCREKLRRIFQDLRCTEISGKLRLYSLECKRLRGNLIEVYKNMREIDRVSPLPSIEIWRNKEYRFTTGEERFDRNLNGNHFTQTVLGIWNELPEEATGAGTISRFQRHLDRYMNEKEWEGYGPIDIHLEGASWLA